MPRECQRTRRRPCWRWAEGSGAGSGKVFRRDHARRRFNRYVPAGRTNLLLNRSPSGGKMHLHPSHQNSRFANKECQRRADTPARFGNLPEITLKIRARHHSLIRRHRLDRPILLMRQRHHLHTPQMRLPLRQRAVVIKQKPFAVELHDGVVVGPADDGFQNHAAVGEGAGGFLCCRVSA
jgi:hypothetical protein